MRLLLATIHAYRSPQAVPLAAACLKAHLDGLPAPRPVTVSLADFFCGDPLEDIYHAIMTEKPDLVAFPMYVWNRAECCRLAVMLRCAAPGLTVIAGGPEATADPAGILKEAPFDFLVAGEGEQTMAEALERLAAGAPLEGLAGIARRGDDGIVVTRRPQVADLASLPSPYLSGVLDRYIADGVLWQLSRGCSFGCEFCFDGMGDRKVRRYPLERIEAELDYLVRRGVKQVVVLDSTFNHDAERARQVLRLIHARAPKVHFHFEARAELLDREQARLFAGITSSLQIGLQTADPEVARGVRRPLNRGEFADKIGLLNRSGAVFGFDLIYGLPGDSPERFRQTLDFSLGLYPNSLAIFPLAVLPGTPLADRAQSLGLRHLETPPYSLIESPTFAAGEMTAARRLAAACDVFYSRGKAVAWFNGVAAALRLHPSTFLEEFARWLENKRGGEFAETEFDDGEIHLLQREFLSEIFVRRKVERFLAAALDLVDYHHHYAAAVMAAPPKPLSGGALKKIDPLRQPLALASSARLARFSYDILDLLEAGEPDLKRICGVLRPVGSFAVIYPRSAEVATESLAEPYFRLLEMLDGAAPAGPIASSLSIPAAEAREFLAFALKEGIVIPG